MEQTNKQEETLEDVIKSISKSLLKAGLSLLRVNIKYWYCIAVCLVIGVAIFFITKPQKQFNAEFIAQSFEVPALMIADEINTINNNGKDVVVKELGLDKADAEKLIGIAAFPVADFNGDRVMDKVIYSGVDETSQKYYFCIRITGNLLIKITIIFREFLIHFHTLTLRLVIVIINYVTLNLRLIFYRFIILFLLLRFFFFLFFCP